MCMFSTTNPHEPAEDNHENEGQEQSQAGGPPPKHGGPYCRFSKPPGLRKSHGGRQPPRGKGDGQIEPGETYGRDRASALPHHEVNVKGESETYEQDRKDCASSELGTGVPVWISIWIGQLALLEWQAFQGRQGGQPIAWRAWHL